MSISKINNSSYFSKSQNLSSPKSLSSFQGKHFSGEQDDAAVEKLSDDDLKTLASIGPNYRFGRVTQNTIKALLVTVPLLDTAVSGLVKKGNLSDKLLKSAGTAGKWGAVFAVAAAFGAVKGFVNSKSETLDKFNKKHSMISTAIDFAVLYTGFNAFLNGSKNLFEYTKNSFPKIVNGFKNVISNPLKNMLNSSFVNKKLVKPAEHFVSKHPNLAAANKVTASLLVPTMAVAVLLRFSKEAKNHDKDVQNNYQFLKGINNLLPDKD